MIIRIAPENISLLWRDQLEPMVTAALRDTPTHVAEDVRISLLGLQSHMFAKMDGPVVLSFIVSQFSAYPQGVWLHIWLTASLDTIPFDVPAFLAVADEWRKLHGCRGLQMACARDGWRKKFPRESFAGITIRLTEGFNYG